MAKGAGLLGIRLPLLYKRTRKAFILEYFCSSLLLILLFFSYLLKIELKSWIVYSVLGLALAILAFAETGRILLRYRVEEEKIEIIEGIIIKNKKNIYFHPLGFVVDIDVHQGRIQRLLGFGTISVAGAGGNSFEIKDIDSPHELMHIIEELVELSKNPERKKV